MPLAAGLRDKVLILNCPHCGHALAKSGAWFAAVSWFKCDGCGGKAPLTYTDKMALYDAHAHLIATKASAPSRRRERDTPEWPKPPDKTKRSPARTDGLKVLE